MVILKIKTAEETMKTVQIKMLTRTGKESVVFEAEGKNTIEDINRTLSDYIVSAEEIVERGEKENPFYKAIFFS